MKKKFYSILISACILSNSTPIFVYANIGKPSDLPISKKIVQETVASTSARIYLNGQYVGTTASTSTSLAHNIGEAAQKIWGKTPDWIKSKIYEDVINFAIKTTIGTIDEWLFSYTTPSSPPSVRAVIGRNGEIITINNFQSPNK